MHSIYDYFINEGSDIKSYTYSKFSIFNFNDSSGEVIRRSYGVWYTECFTSPTMDEEDLTSLCKFMGYSSGIVNNDTVLTDEIMVPKRDEFYAVKMNEMSWMFLRNDKPLITLEKSNETCYRTFVTCS